MHYWLLVVRSKLVRTSTRSAFVLHNCNCYCKHYCIFFSLYIVVICTAALVWSTLHCGLFKWATEINFDWLTLSYSADYDIQCNLMTPGHIRHIKKKWVHLKCQLCKGLIPTNAASTVGQRKRQQVKKQSRVTAGSLDYYFVFFVHFLIMLFIYNQSVVVAIYIYILKYYSTRVLWVIYWKFPGISPTSGDCC